MEKPKYNRIVLKLSGEALAGEQGNGINPTVIQSIAKQVKEIAELDVEVAVVVGGGNLWRGKTGSDLGMDRATADYMGIRPPEPARRAADGRLRRRQCRRAADGGGRPPLRKNSRRGD